METVTETTEILDVPKYVAYAVNHDGVYIWEMQTKKLRFHIPLVDIKHSQCKDITHIKSILGFNEKYLVFIYYDLCLCKYNWKTRTIESFVKMGDGWTYFYHTQQKEFWKSTCESIDLELSDLVYLPFQVEFYRDCATHEELIEYPHVPVQTSTFVPKGKYSAYWNWYHRDLRGYSYLVDLTYNIQINDVNHEPIWIDDKIHSKLKEESVSKPFAQITSVTVLDCLVSDLAIFAKRLQNYLPFIFEEFPLLVAMYL